MMIKTIEQVIQSVLPDELVADVKNNVTAVVNHNFEKMDLVTREQLEIQEKIIDRTREKVTQLEQKLTQLEALIKD